MDTQEAPFLTGKDLKQFLASCEEEYDRPEPVWSNPGSLDGEWLYPVWRTDHWEFEARCMPC